MAGPVLGSFVYSMTGYMETFLFFAFLGLVSLLAVLIFVPNTLNQNSKRKSHTSSLFLLGSDMDSLAQTEQSATDKTSQSSTSEIFYYMFFNNSRSVFALLACAMIVVFLDFYQSILSVHLLETYQLGADYNGFIFAVPCLTYCLSTPHVSFFIDRVSSRRQFILLSLLLCFVSLLLAGPSPTLGFGNSLWLLVFGLGMNGVAAGFAFIPIYPEIMEAVMENEGIREETDELCDKVAGIYGTFFSLGSMIAPVFGGFLGQSLGYRGSCDVVALITLCFVFIYFLANTAGAKKKSTRVHEHLLFMKQISAECS